MQYHFEDIDLFPSFCADPSADNCFEFADGAHPVYLDDDGDGEPVLTTRCGRLERPYGLLYTLYESRDEEKVARTIVVRC